MIFQLSTAQVLLYYLVKQSSFLNCNYSVYIIQYVICQRSGNTGRRIQSPFISYRNRVYCGISQIPSCFCQIVLLQRLFVRFVCPSLLVWLFHFEDRHAVIIEMAQNYFIYNILQNGGCLVNRFSRLLHLGNDTSFSDLNYV